MNHSGFTHTYRMTSSMDSEIHASDLGIVLEDRMETDNTTPEDYIQANGKFNKHSIEISPPFSPDDGVFSNMISGMFEHGSLQERRIRKCGTLRQTRHSSGPCHEFEVANTLSINIGQKRNRTAAWMESRSAPDTTSLSHSMLYTSSGSLSGSHGGSGAPRSCVRRESFLYRSETAEGGDASPTQRSRQSSLNLHDVISEQSDLMVVTPFAQLINALRNVRNNYLYLHDIPGSRKSSTSQSTSPLALSSDDVNRKKMVVDTLQELDWCLEQLEGIQTLKSAGHVAARKFKRMLSRELNQFSQSSKDGSRMCDYISRTFLDSAAENETLPDVEEVMWNHDSSESLNPDTPATSMSVIAGLLDQAPVVESNSLIPKYGVPVPDEHLMDLHMQDLNEWGLDLFKVSEVSHGRPLTVVTYRILKNSGLLKTFKIAEYQLVNYLTQLESHYKSDKYYHNAVHAADVTQSVHVLLRLPSLQNVFSDLEVLAAIFAAAVHDVDHPGVTNQFLINTNAELAVMYNDVSVLENHHAALAFKMLQCEDCDIFRTLSVKQRQTLRRMVIGMVLATDMSKHMDHIAHLKTMVEMYRLNSGASKPSLKDHREDKIQILESMIHCADLSNPTKPIKLYNRWTDCIMAEFFQQGDEEKRLGLPVSPMCDRELATVGHSQIGFIDYIVHPLWETLAELVSPDCQYILDTLEANRQCHLQAIEEEKENGDQLDETTNENS